MKSYPIAAKGSFWLGLLGWVAVPVAGSLAGRLLSAATNASPDTQDPSAFPVTQMMAGHALGAAAAFLLRDKVGPGWQSFMKWGAISEVVATASTPVAVAVAKAQQQPALEQASAASPRSLSTPSSSSLALAAWRRFYVV